MCPKVSAEDLQLIEGLGRALDHLRNAMEVAETLAPTISENHLPLIENALRMAAEAHQKLTEQNERIAELEKLATCDDLTGLLNRRGFLVHLETVLKESQRSGAPGLLVFVDLDDFKSVNDTHGHAAGDAVLKAVAQRLRDGVRQSDFVARLGGDEFVLLLANTTWDRGLARARALGRRLNSTCATWEGAVLPIRASLGIVTYTGCEDAAQLLHRADQAMYKVKQGRSTDTDWVAA